MAIDTIGTIPVQCPVCGKNLKQAYLNGLYYAFCPTRSTNHIFELGPHNTEAKLLKQFEKLKEK